MKTLVALAALAAALFGGAGALPLVVEARLASLAPGGLAVTGLNYNPLTGRLTLREVRAHDESGREIFRADEVEATAPLAEAGTALGAEQVVHPGDSAWTAFLKLGRTRGAQVPVVEGHALVGVVTQHALQGALAADGADSPDGARRAA